MKTSELIGPALSWAVALAEGNPYVWKLRHRHIKGWDDYATDWAKAGPIIEAKRLGVLFKPEDQAWWSAPLDGDVEHLGDTPLIAAMRAYVAASLGPEIEVPDDIV
jgi:hypothetical protein